MTNPLFPLIVRRSKAAANFRVVTSPAIRRRSPGGAALLCIALLLSHGWLGAAPLEVGSPVPALMLKDQHDKPVAIPSGLQWVLMASDKPSSDMASALISSEPAGLMAQMRMVYVADVSRMPALITRMFALPKLRELPFAIALAREESEVSQLADFPRQAGAVTLVRVEQGRVVQLSSARTEAELRSALDLPPRGKTP